MDKQFASHEANKEARRVLAQRRALEASQCKVGGTSHRLQMAGLPSVANPPLGFSNWLKKPQFAPDQLHNIALK